MTEATPVETLIRVMQAAFELARAFEKRLQSIAEQAASYLEKAQPSLMALAQIDWVAAMQRLDAMPKKSREAMRLALAEGWFFGWHDGLQSVLELVEKLVVTAAADVDDVMLAYYRLNLRPFADELISKYPDRATAIKAASNAHTSLSDDGYFLSIPVFIAQADGLLAEIIGVESPLSKAGKILREKYGNAPEVLDLLCPFLELEGSHFMMRAKGRKDTALTSGKSFTALNRHQVMHGECSDYGTETNSLKAFSFLVCVGLHMPVVMDR